MQRLNLLRIFIVSFLFVFGIISISPQPALAQGTIEDQVFAVVSQQLGIIPSPTKGQLDRGDASLPFVYAYEKDGLDLNASGGGVTCDARVLGDDEMIIGWVGYRVIVTVEGRRYEFRTNGTGSQIIRCVGGRPADNNFGAAASLGAYRPGDSVADQAFRHLSNYLQLNPVITLADVQRLGTDEEPEDYPYSVFYRWDATLFSNSALNCPGAGQQFRNGDAAGYLMYLTVNGRTYQYRSSLDGAVLIFCLGGRADISSQGVTIPAPTE
jgi:hypothetical protein